MTHRINKLIIIGGSEKRDPPYFDFDGTRWRLVTSYFYFSIKA